IALVGVLVLLIPLSWWLMPTRWRSPYAPATQEVMEGQPAEAAADHGAKPELNDGYFSIRSMISRAEGLQRVSSLQYLLTQCIVIPRYLRMVFVPYGFNVDHDVPVVRQLTLPVALGALLLLLLFAAGVVSRERWPILGFGILWTYVALSV